MLLTDKLCSAYCSSFKDAVDFSQGRFMELVRELGIEIGCFD